MRRTVSLAVLVLALLLSSCRGTEPAAPVPASQTGGEEDAARLIGVSFPMTDLMFRAAMFQLLETRFPGGEGEPVQLILCDGENSQRKQNQDLMDLLKLPVDGIILIPYTMEGPLSVVQYANDQGIPVLTLDNRVEASSLAKTVSYVGADHLLMGEQAAHLLIEALEARFPQAERWNVIYLTGIPNSSGAVDRDTGINQVLSQESRVQLLGEYNGEFTSVNAKSILEDCLNIYPEIHGVICQNDFMAEGCYQALEERGMAGSVALVGIDGQRSIVEKIAQGKIDGTVIQYPDMVLEAVARMCAYLGGETLQYAYYQPTDPITRDNAQAYLDAGLPW